MISGLKTIRLSALVLLLVTVAALAAACGGDDPTPTAVPAAATPTPVDPVQAQYDALYAAALEEGGVVRIAGHPSEYRRSAWMVFEERFPGMTVEYVGLPGSESNARIQSEWEAGVWEWDILSAGNRYLVGSYATENHMLDMHDVLFDPEVLDDSKWLGGSMNTNFLDSAEKYLLSYHVFIAETAFVRDDLAPVASFKSLTELLNPKYKGKVCWVDPRLGGTPQYMSAFLLQSQGEAFVTELLSTHEPVIFGDTLQMVTEMVKTDNCPIGIGVTRPVLKEFQDEGLGMTIARIAPADGLFQGGSNSVSVPINAPHPNAAKLMANWFLSADGQTQWAELGRENSRRIDVPMGNPERMPTTDQAWYDFSKEASNYAVCCLLPLRALADEVLAGR